MATPIASGIVALVREAAPSLDAFEVMDVIRNSSEIRDKPANTISDRWHEKWGFGLIDASCAIDFALDQPCTPLEDTGVVNPPPSGNGSAISYQLANHQTIRGGWKAILRRFQALPISRRVNNSIRYKYG